MQNPDNHHQWINKARPYWQLAYHGNRGGMTAQIILNHQVKVTTYRATPGPGVTHARFKELIVMENPDTHKELARRLEIHPVTIEGGAR
jgi:hypothetical protein